MDRPPMMNDNPPPAGSGGLREPYSNPNFPPQQQNFYPGPQQGGNFGPPPNGPPPGPGGPPPQGNYPPPQNYHPPQSYPPNNNYGGAPPPAGLRNQASPNNNYDNRPPYDQPPRQGGGGSGLRDPNIRDNRGFDSRGGSAYGGGRPANLAMNNYRGDEDFIRRQRYPRLYVGKLPRGFRKNEVLDLFEAYGEVVDSMFKEEYCFIEYSNLRSSAIAQRELDGYDLRGNRITVEESKPRQNDQKKSNNKAMGQAIKYPRLYVGKIGGCRSGELEKLFERFGSIVDCMVQKEQDYGFVEFQTCEQAQRAMEALHHSRFKGQRINVEESKPRNDGLPRDAPPSGRRGQATSNPVTGQKVLAKNAQYAKIRGLPFNQNKGDLITLVHKDAPEILSDHIVLEFDICGKFTGSAYVKLNNPNELNDLKRLEKETLGKRFVEVIPVDQEDYEYGIANNVSEDPRVNKESKDGENSSGLIRIRGIPYKCTEEQIRLLLKGFQILEVKLLSQGDRQAGEAIVVFTSKEASLHSLNWEGQQIEGRYVEITLSNMKEFETFMKNNWDVNKIKDINEKEEKRLKDQRAQRMSKLSGSGGQSGMGQPGRGRKDSRGNMDDRERSRPRNNNRGVHDRRGSYEGGNQQYGGNRGGYGGGYDQGYQNYGGYQQGGQQQQQYPPQQQYGQPPPQQQFQGPAASQYYQGQI